MQECARELFPRYCLADQSSRSFQPWSYAIHVVRLDQHVDRVEYVKNGSTVRRPYSGNQNAFFRVLSSRVRPRHDTAVLDWFIDVVSSGVSGRCGECRFQETPTAGCVESVWLGVRERTRRAWGEGREEQRVVLDVDVGVGVGICGREGPPSVRRLSRVPWWGRGLRLVRRSRPPC